MESHFKTYKETCAAIGKTLLVHLTAQPRKGGSLGKGEVYLVLGFS